MTLRQGKEGEVHVGIGPLTEEPQIIIPSLVLRSGSFNHKKVTKLGKHSVVQLTSF